MKTLTINDKEFYYLDGRVSIIYVSSSTKPFSFAFTNNSDIGEYITKLEFFNKILVDIIVDDITYNNCTFEYCNGSSIFWPIDSEC
jgi:hypothetical protein